MSRKRRMFDIEMPDREAPAEGPQIRSLEEPVKRRGPMASAIVENAGALSERAAAEARIRAENDALAHEFVGLRREGRIAQRIPLDAVVTQALIRDRKPGPDFELPELMASIRDVGLSNPIRVEARDDGKFELIQGYRRLSAYRALRDEHGDTWATIPASVLPRGEGIAGLYRQMVDENLIRKDLSFAEMASVAQAYAADPDTDPQNVSDAVAELFKSAAYTKRSYIRSFAKLLDLIGPLLAYPQEVPRNLGLSVLRRIEEDEGVVAHLRARLKGLDNRSVKEELEVLREIVAAGPLDEDIRPPSQATSAGQGVGRRPRTTFEIAHASGRVKCTAGVGQLSLKLDRDMTAVERRKLEAGIARLLDALD